MSLRQEKQQEFFVQHMETFRKLGIMDPFFVIKTAFYQKGKYGRQVQFFEWELKKGEDIYIEFYDNITNDSGVAVNLKPFHEDRLLCKFKVNPHYAEEYEQKENVNQKTGDTYLTYTIPLSELIAVSPDGREMTYSMYEKAKENAVKEEVGMPRLQNSLAFPNFEEEMVRKDPKLEQTTLQDILVGDDAPLTDMTITDFAAIMWKKPVSNKLWLNSLIEKQ